MQGKWKSGDIKSTSYAKLQMAYEVMCYRKAEWATGGYSAPKCQGISEPLIFMSVGAKPPTALFAAQIRAYPQCVTMDSQRPARIFRHSSGFGFRQFYKDASLHGGVPVGSVSW